MGFDAPYEGDVIKSGWQNSEFVKLCDELATFQQPKVIDVIFTLLDWNSRFRDAIIENINKSKSLTQNTNQQSNSTLVSDNQLGEVMGITYIS